MKYIAVFDIPDNIEPYNLKALIDFNIDYGDEKYNASDFLDIDCNAIPIKAPKPKNIEKCVDVQSIKAIGYNQCLEDIGVSE